MQKHDDLSEWCLLSRCDMCNCEGIDDLSGDDGETSFILHLPS